MVITCPNCSAFQLEIEALTYPEGKFRTHCKCNHDVTIVIRPGATVQVLATYRPSPKRRVRSLEDSKILEKRQINRALHKEGTLHWSRAEGTR